MKIKMMFTFAVLFHVKCTHHTTLSTPLMEYSVNVTNTSHNAMRIFGHVHDNTTTDTW